MANKKNLVEEALLQMENLQEAISENAKGILASTMKEEISELVKESMSETNEDNEIEVSETEMSEQEELDDVEVGDEEEVDMEDLGLEDPEDEMDTDELELDLGNEEMLMTDIPGDDLEVDSEEEVLLPLDLTQASDSEVLKVFKAMGEDDGIIVKQDGDDVHLADTETDAEYVIQLGESEEEVKEGDYGGNKGDESKSRRDYMEEDDHMEEGEYKEDDHMEESIVYEIEIEEDDICEDGDCYEEETIEEETIEEETIEEEDSEDGDSEDGDSEDGDSKEKGETKEGSARSHVNGRATNLKPEGFPENLKRKGVRENKKLKNELTQLREKNEEYRKALNVFKEKLNEVAIFNSNLAYATRLFTEHSTTKQEKINILRRFDGVETLKESKSLYKTIKEDLGGKEQNVVTESVQSKVSKTPTKGSSNNLIESKTYENPQFLRMRDLMSKIK